MKNKNTAGFYFRNWSIEPLPTHGIELCHGIFVRNFRKSDNAIDQFSKNNNSNNSDNEPVS